MAHQVLKLLQQKPQ